MSVKLLYEVTIFPKEYVKLKKFYIEISAGHWKQHLYNRRHSFSNKSLKQQIILSRHYWDLVDNVSIPQLEWRIISKARTPNKLKNPSFFPFQILNNFPVLIFTFFLSESIPFLSFHSTKFESAYLT